MNFEQLRRNMVNNLLRPQKVQDFDVLRAMGVVARELHLPLHHAETMRASLELSAWQGLVYNDSAVTVSGGNLPAGEFGIRSELGETEKPDGRVALRDVRVMLPPVVLARMVQALGVRAGDPVLLVGAGGGEGAAVLHTMGAVVEATEDHPDLWPVLQRALNGMAHVTLKRVGVREALHTGGGRNKVLVGVPLPRVPADAPRLLAEGGQMVLLCPNAAGVMQVLRVVRHGRTVLSEMVMDTPTLPIPDSLREAEAFVF